MAERGGKGRSGDLPLSGGNRIPGAEIVEWASRSSGPGGQHVNTSSTRVTLRWNLRESHGLKSEAKARLIARLRGKMSREGILMVHADRQRSRERNREVARARLHEIVETALYPGILELLRTLRDRPMPMAVLSNKPHDMTCALVDHFLDEVPFVAVAGAVDGKPKKPDPVFAAPLLGALGLPPERVLMVGDTKTDMLTARATGMRGVGVTWGFRDRAELEEHGAEHVIDSAAALLDLL